MSETFIFIHSPLVGPLTWIPVAEEISRAGYRALVPSLQDALAVPSGFGRAFADSVASEVASSGVEGPLHLVAHSGAGFFMPVFREALSVPIAGYIFVDARIPKGGASLFDDSPESDVEHLKAMARDGWLPPWSEWFERDAIMEILPDRDIRERFIAELSPIPVAMFEEQSPVLDSWPDAPCGYIRLSASYLAETETARSMEWLVREVDSAHLQMLVDPIAIMGLMLEVQASLGSARER